MAESVAGAAGPGPRRFAAKIRKGARMNRTEGNARKLVLGTSLAAVVLLMAATMSGCAPTALVNVWRDPSIASPRLDKVLVISLRKDATRRRMWEDAFASELSRYGVTATQSYRLCPGAAPDTGQMGRCLNEGDFNGVLTIAPLSPTIEKQYVPGYWSTDPGMWFSPYWDRYYRWWWQYQQPGYVETYTLTRNEIDVYLTHKGGETMVWSGTSDQTDPATMEEVRASVVAQVVAKLAKQGIISGTK
jgi:hypothetical protein